MALFEMLLTKVAAAASYRQKQHHRCADGQHMYNSVLPTPDINLLCRPSPRLVSCRRVATSARMWPGQGCLCACGPDKAVRARMPAAWTSLLCACVTRTMPPPHTRHPVKPPPHTCRPDMALSTPLAQLRHLSLVSTSAQQRLRISRYHHAALYAGIAFAQI